MKGLAKYCANEFRGGNEVSPEKISSGIITIPNLITSFGICLTFFLFYQIYKNFLPWLIPINVVLIGLSDLVDGYAACKLNQHSWLGKFMDGFRDRLLGTAILLIFILFAPGITTYFLVAILVSQEIYIAYANYLSICNQRNYNVHVANKMRQFIHIACGLTLVTQHYWIENVILNNHSLLAIMVIGSLGITAFKFERAPSF